VKTRRFPVIATLVVLAAVAVMLRLGFWQLERRHEKAALLARYAAAEAAAQEIAWPSGDAEASLYRRARLICARVTGRSAMAGHNARGETGWAQTATCKTPGGDSVLVVLGWSARTSDGTAWNGGEVRGTIAPGPRLVADPPLAGLAANETPDASAIPNNHLSYAVQWFLFAAVALAIYAAALLKRGRHQGLAPDVAPD
jgi:surfeit locus 1 family protein